MYRVAWYDLTTGESGHGEYCLTQAQAVAWATAMSLKYPNIAHWPEKQECEAP